jgi:hypothetical protein
MCDCEIDIIQLCMRFRVCVNICILCSFTMQRTAVRTGMGISVQHCVGGHLQGYRLGLGTCICVFARERPSL